MEICFWKKIKKSFEDKGTEQKCIACAGYQKDCPQYASERMIDARINVNRFDKAYRGKPLLVIPAD